jgi:polyhydroxyalkanoate synthase
MADVVIAGTAEDSGGADAGPSRPDMMFGLWVSWMQKDFGSPKDWTGTDKQWWQVTPDDVAGKLLAGSVRQLNEIPACDPRLHSVDQMWNANPFCEVIPVDWAEIARALRTVSLHSLRDPKSAMASVAGPDMSLWRAAIDVWNDAGKRWWDVAGAAVGQARACGRRRQTVRGAGMAQQLGLPHAEGAVSAGFG